MTPVQLTEQARARGLGPGTELGTIWRPTNPVGMCVKVLWGTWGQRGQPIIIPGSSFGRSTLRPSASSRTHEQVTALVSMKIRSTMLRRPPCRCGCRGRWCGCRSGRAGIRACSKAVQMHLMRAAVPPQQAAYNRRCGIAGTVPVVPAPLSTTRRFTMRRHRSGPVPPNLKRTSPHLTARPLWDQLTHVQRHQLARLVGQLLARRLRTADRREVSHDSR